MKDLEALIDDMQKTAVHVKTANREVEAPERKGFQVLPNDGSPGRWSMVEDIMATGAAMLHGGKLSEFIEKTTFDPALGYPTSLEDIGEARVQNDADASDAGLGNKEGHPVLDSIESQYTNSEIFKDLDDGGDEDMECPGVGGLGGGGEFQ